MLSRLHLTDFKVFHDIEFTFIPGITAIVGPNGSGKTTLLEAIEFALFRQVTRKEKTVRNFEDFIRHGRKRAFVELDFRAPVNRRMYRVKRSIHPGKTNAELYELGNREPLFSGPSKVDDEIVGLLGMDRHAFSALTYVRQGEIDRLSRLSPQKRRTDIYNMMGLGIYDKTSEKVQKQLRDLKKRISIIEDTISRLESVRSHLPEPEEVSAARHALSSLRAKYENSTDEWSKIGLVLDKISSSLQSVLENLESPELTGEFEELKEEQDVASYLKSVIETLPGIAEAQLKPHVRDEAREIFRGIFGDRYSDLIIDENYDVSLFDLRGNKVSLAAASGGEDVCVNFALRVAVNAALQSHGSHGVPPPGMIILDEPGAGLDSLRRKWLPMAIAGLKSIEQVLVVTHMEELRESADRIVLLTPQGKNRQPLVEVIE